MNEERRKELSKAIKILESIKDQIEEAQNIVSQASEEEREYYDNMPEGLQQSERGYRAEEAAGALEEASGTLEEFDIEELISQIETASE